MTRRQVGSSSMALEMVIILISIDTVASINCLQCTGWSGNYPGAEPNPCSNYNNQCQSQQLCVRIVDPIIPSAGYSTFKADCWTTPTVQTSPAVATTIIPGQCYDVVDGSLPPKKYRYCYCNNKDFCNGKKGTAGGLLLITAFLTYQFHH